VKIFISYRTINRALVTQLVNDLSETGYTVWYDQELTGGQNWWNGILHNIQQCDLLIFALTPQSIDSYPCRLEYSYANALGKPIIPVELIKVSFSLLPEILMERQIINYVDRDVSNYRKLINAIISLPSTPVLPDPLPPAPDMPVSPLAPVRERIDSPNLPLEQQVAILHQLKGYLYHDEYDSSARELLHRLSQHPMLLASVDKDIKAALAAPRLVEPPPQPEPPPYQPPPPKEIVNPAVPEKEPPPPAFQVDEGERILRELDVSFVGGGLVGLASGLVVTAGMSTVATAAARKASQKRLIVTDRRLVFMPNTFDQNTNIVPLNEITEIKKVFKLADPAIQINTKSGEEYKFTIVAGVGLWFGNREDLIKLIQQFMPKH
jgi:hypothetical protein